METEEDGRIDGGPRQRQQSRKDKRKEARQALKRARQVRGGMAIATAAPDPPPKPPPKQPKAGQSQPQKTVKPDERTKNVSTESTKEKRKAPQSALERMLEAQEGRTAERSAPNGRGGAVALPPSCHYGGELTRKLKQKKCSLQ